MALACETWRGDSSFDIKPSHDRRRSRRTVLRQTPRTVMQHCADDTRSELDVALKGRVRAKASSCHHEWTVRNPSRVGRR